MANHELVVYVLMSCEILHLGHIIMIQKAYEVWSSCCWVTHG